MPARDKYHYTVEQALIKDGWTVTGSLSFKSLGATVEIDHGAEKLFAAEKGLQKIAVEVKSFIGLSLFYDFHTALGQFINYRRLLRHEEPHRVLYLGITLTAYNALLNIPLVQLVIDEENIKLLVVNHETEEVVLWKE